MKKELDILYQIGDYWIVKNDKGDFEVYKEGITHATLMDTIGRNYSLNPFIYAKHKAEKRAAKDIQKKVIDITNQSSLGSEGVESIKGFLLDQMTYPVSSHVYEAYMNVLAFMVGSNEAEKMVKSYQNLLKENDL